MKTKYLIEYDFMHEVVVEVDDDIFTEEKAAEINLFWSNAESRKIEDGSHLNAVLKMLASLAFRLSVEVFNVKNAFDWNAGKGQEGWPAMDGSEGIELISVDEFEWETTEMSICKIPN